MITTLLNLTRRLGDALARLLGWPRIVETPAVCGDAAPVPRLEPVARGVLQVAIEHDGQRLEQCLAFDANARPVLTIHSAASEPNAMPDASMPMLRLTLCNLWSLLTLKAHKVLRLRLAQRSDLAKQRVRLTPLPADFLKPPGKTATDLIGNRRAFAADVPRRPVNVPCADVAALRFHRLDAGIALAGTRPPSRLTAPACNFRTVLVGLRQRNGPPADRMGSFGPSESS